MGPDEGADHETYDLGVLEIGTQPEPPRPRPRHPLSRRWLVVGVAVLVVAVGANAVVQHHDSPHPKATAVAPKPDVPAPVVPQPTGLPMPEIYRSGQLLRAAVIDLSRPGPTSFTVTATRPGPDFAVRCPYGMTGSAQFEVRVKGHLVLGSGCSGPDPDNTLGRVDGTIDASAALRSWREVGVRLGSSVTVVVTVTQPAFATSPAPLMTVGVFQQR
jgi:hypothetical protein